VNSVYVSVDVADVLADVSTKDLYHGWSDDALMDVVKDIAGIMKTPQLRSLLGMERDGEPHHYRFVSHDDEILDSMIEEARGLNDWHLEERLTRLLEEHRYPVRSMR
jgi:hypothetical protein